jgi:hypothetical protein
MKLLRSLALFTLAALPALGGPPYTTDDPEPVPLRNWELYLSATRLHLIVPVAYTRPTGGPTAAGLGDLELGAKYRFVEETEGGPQIGAFPLVDLPSGDAARGLGSGHVRAFLPVWLQKSFGKWTTYGGGGYWVNPGAGNRDYWLAGWQLQVELTPFLKPGAEIFTQTASVDGGRTEVHYNLGLVVDLGEHHHLLFSAGRAVHGCDCTHVYASYLLTLGPAP